MLQGKELLEQDSFVCVFYILVLLVKLAHNFV
jgi:hypothetical protein